MSLRVIAGEFRGRKLALPRGADIRPTADRVREALFASLGAAVRDAEVADLCAGTGALGIEALSRGAASAVFVERSMRSVWVSAPSWLPRTPFPGFGVRQRPV